MSVIVPKISFYDYFDYNETVSKYDMHSAVALFCFGMRPIEFMNISKTNIDLDSNSITFQQAKGGRITTRNAENEVLSDILTSWNYDLNSKNHYRNYQRLDKYLLSMFTPKFNVSNRLNNLYAFRYSCCAALIHAGFNFLQIFSFFDHENTANTVVYLQEGYKINLQIYPT